MNETTFHGIVVMLSVMALFVLFMTAWQRFVVDAVRQRAFEVRDKALLWAYDHGRLDSDEYKDFRNIINSSIRYYEEMSLAKVLTMLAIRKERPHLKNMGGTKFLNDQHLANEFNKLTITIMLGLLIRSPFSFISIMLLSPLYILWKIMSNGPSKPERIAKRLQNEVQVDLLNATPS